ncbi:uncharacterized protein ACLA_089750 [Aspergillus clavatus NRRL 1]|uniref:Uncharacterized protein n=1 Tax=Aspergillus clavatus (strain ATCC 1007 / CBS 513.65 / DSM 816 / NCTC 3887 / NRRL 1 / QM 1276 / 107) TaxID=344612 RepID=A1CEI4_ASPCL|nr:uncharacterized protein ACLA_089750 [Aspergillus clavatus NRRL 1]EAW11283.1 conserved hypothetical protein [Aspergillus clavatus NRRL 1]
MSLGRHAYRHAIQPGTSSCLLDHVWISEDFLATTFRRFAAGQRRYESRVPGPLEARRRLAKRRNTALAGIAGSGPLEDIACLFGRNGREHMKWTDRQERKVHPETQVYPLSPPDPPLPFYSENVNSSQFDVISGRPGPSGGAQKASREQSLEEFLESRPSVTDIRSFVRQLNLDTQRETSYSRLILKHLLERCLKYRAAMNALIEFLDDPYLNPRGTGNYLCTLEHILPQKLRFSPQRPFAAIIRALELGLIHPDEIRDIVRTISEVELRPSEFSTRNKRFLIRFHREMWEGIGRCDVYRHRDLSKDFIEEWLGILWGRRTHNDVLLAKDIILATYDSTSPDCPWVPKLIIRWLKVSTETRHGTDENYVRALMGHFHPEVASEFAVRVTEYLASTSKEFLVEWQYYLSQLDNIPTLVSSEAWINVDKHIETSSSSSTSANTSKFPVKHQIILRLWVLRTLSRHLPEGPLWRQEPRATDLPIVRLLRIYESTLDESIDEDFLSDLMKEIHVLDIPFNGLLMAAVELKAGRRMSRGKRRTLEKLETTKVSFYDIFSDIHAYNATKTHFFPVFEKMTRQIDVSNPSFVKHAVGVARTGNAQAIWTLIRMLRSHTPLKVALSKSSQRIPDPSEMSLTRYYPDQRTEHCPDPHLASEMIHLFAVSIACSKNLSPRVAYKFVHWLYTFLVSHNATVKPSLVRAMYHAGVLRFRREGLRVAPTQYAYIFERVKEIEMPEMVQALMEPPRVGETVKHSDLD